ncbi:hypothetical protein [Prauserella cavernicola]|uniref:Uncharacterized protein n=1 Tax=Prauserella cavernicola TaxID=2800127 RepID=A0A934QQR7_9PSEU|nr:hypothetical protein [Prauserella cavernicola]MBK1783994.1 hypothetical protein [Prauserella cavernicola]
MAEGKAAAVVSRLGQINREMAERRALRDRKAKVAKEQAKETFQRQGQVADRAAKHLGELGRRQREAGGWATEKSLTERNHVMGFGESEAEQPADEFAKYSTGAPVERAASTAPPPPAAPAEPAAQPQRKFSRSVAPPQQEEPEKSAPPPPPQRAPRHAREERFDDDDFSNNNWLK